VLGRKSFQNTVKASWENRRALTKVGMTTEIRMSCVGSCKCRAKMLNIKDTNIISSDISYIALPRVCSASHYIRSQNTAPHQLLIPWAVPIRLRPRMIVPLPCLSNVLTSCGACTMPLCFCLNAHTSTYRSRCLNLSGTSAVCCSPQWTIYPF
jgi:hypothetical protein